MLEVSKPEVSLVLPQPEAGDAKKGLYVFLAYPFPGPKLQRPLTPGLTHSFPSLPPLTPRQWCSTQSHSLPWPSAAQELASFFSLSPLLHLPLL